MRACRLLGLLAAALLAGAGSAEAQYYELFAPKTTPYHVGDTLVFLGKLTGVEQMSPVDSAAKPAQPMPDGVRLVRVDPFRRIKNGHYEANVVFQYFRSGTHTLPPMIIRVRNLGADPGRVISAVADPIEVVASIPPAGEPRPEDIRALQPVGPPAWPIVLGLLVLGALAVWLVRRWHAAREAARAAAGSAPATLAPKDARAAALARLAALQQADYARHGDIARHYGETVDVLRDFLHAIRRSPRQRPATDELLTSLARAAGIPAESAPLLVEADFVKFARVRPDAESAGRFLGAARQVVERWEEER